LSGNIDNKPMDSVFRVRAHQREWMENIRVRVTRGEPFAVCHADEVEEIFNVMDIPVMVINYWNSIIANKGLTQYYTDVLNNKGYDAATTGTLLLSAGFASALDNKPEVAPWGGLPKPTIILGSRSDSEWKMLELWAKTVGSHFYPMDLRGGEADRKITENWWERVVDHWDEMVNAEKLDYKVARVKELISFLEVITKRSFSMTKLNEAMELVNEHVEYYAQARDLVIGSTPCPVHVKEHLAMQQSMWHRGTVKGRDMMKAYYEEVKERVRNGYQAYPKEKIRILWEDGTPPLWGAYLQEKYGAICLAPYFASITRDGYKRKVLNHDPLRALVSRQFMFIASTPGWRLKDARTGHCDALIRVYNPVSSSRTKLLNAAIENSGLPVLEIPRNSDDPEIRGILDNFFKTRLSKIIS
jgi:hypothetical protein